MSGPAWVAIAFALGMVAGVVVGAMLWRADLEEARDRIAFLERLGVMHEDLGRHWQAQSWYERALLGDEDALAWLGASAGLVTVFNQPPFATAESRNRAAELYRSATERLRRERELRAAIERASNPYLGPG